MSGVGEKICGVESSLVWNASVIFAVELREEIINIFSPPVKNCNETAIITNNNSVFLKKNLE